MSGSPHQEGMGFSGTETKTISNLNFVFLILFFFFFLNGSILLANFQTFFILN